MKVNAKHTTCVLDGSALSKIEVASPDVQDYPVCFYHRNKQRKLEFEGKTPRQINGRLKLNV